MQLKVVFIYADPKFVKAFEIQYHFQRVQLYKVAIYDVDEEGDPYEIVLEDQVTGSIT